MTDVLQPDEKPSGAAFRSALSRLQCELLASLEGARGVRALEEATPEIDELTRDLDAQLERATQSAVLCLVGSTGAGKSTLLNALVGREIATEGIDRPTTSAPVIYRPVDADVSELVASLPGDPPRVVTYDASARQAGGTAQNGDGFWRGQVLIDAPDVNSVATLHREIVAELSARSDVLVVVAHRQSIAELSSATFVDLFAERRGMVFVLGRRDELDQDSEAELLGQLKSLRDGRWNSPDAPVLSISAKEAKERPGGGGIDELRSELFDIIRAEKLGSIRRRNALGSVARISRIGSAARDSSAGAAERFEDTLQAGAAAWSNRLGAAIQERLDVRRSDLAEMLWNDAAKAWDGPGGYALRVGGLSALGLGAGAAVARRNPVLAAGLAVGSVAADRMRGAVRERHFESTSGLLPAATDIELFQRDAFVEARLAADELYVPDASSAMTPTGEELDGLAGRAVDEAWDRVLRVDLPREGARAVPRPVRWLVDLPVIGMGVWVLVRVVLGFVNDNYVGVDFLVSAVIIALGWLFLSRWLIRARLASKSKALLAAAREDIEQRIGAAAQQSIENRLVSLRSSRAALEAVASADEVWRARLHGER